MSTFSRYSLIACITLLANNAWAGLNPVPGPEFGEGSIGLGGVISEVEGRVEELALGGYGFTKGA